MLETAQNSIKLFTDKESIVYSYSGLLFRNNTKWKVDTMTSRNFKNMTQQEMPGI